jgi:four helix bundle protein
LSTFPYRAANLARKQGGTIGALATGMATAKRFEDLVAWQLSEQLKEEIFRLLQRPRVAHDVRFCDDIQRSARSAPANISEGFGWYQPKPNARHVSIARASLEETKNHILDGFKRNHFDLADRDALLRLHKRAVIATMRYLRYLKSCKHAPEGKPYKRRPGTGATNNPGQEPQVGWSEKQRRLRSAEAGTVIAATEPSTED